MSGNQTQTIEDGPYKVPRRSRPGTPSIGMEVWGSGLLQPLDDQGHQHQRSGKGDQQGNGHRKLHGWNPTDHGA